MIQVLTGPGKGKTTAALGGALRAVGHGWKVLMVQFMKGDPNYGEVIATRTLPGFELIQSGLPTFVEKGNPSLEDVRLAQQGLALARQAIADRRCRMLILDEVNVAIDYGLVALDDVLDLLRSCPREMELVLTGRYAPAELVAAADLVSEVQEVKHPYMQGIVSREGIDY
jgi:cob(I)alamin adenosyltransferase